MSKTTVGILAGLGGLAVGFGIGALVVRHICKAKIVGGAESFVGALGGSSSIQKVAGRIVGAFVDEAS